VSTRRASCRLAWRACVKGRVGVSPRTHDDLLEGAEEGKSDLCRQDSQRPLEGVCEEEWRGVMEIRDDPLGRCRRRVAETG